MQSETEIRRCLSRAGGEVWARGPMRFLAQGEYNENWLLTGPDGPCVLRVNHGSQLGLEHQIDYEYSVLELLAESGVTPRPIQLLANCGLGRGALLMEYLPGGPLDYVRDSLAAARLFARVHAMPVPRSVRELPAGEGGLVRQPEPVRDIAEESLGLIRRHLDEHALPRVGARLLDYHAEVMELYARTRQEFADEPQVIVNTEVNSGNFLVDRDRLRLVDWEKAVLSCRHQDLGHFLAPTTTLWKTDYRFPPGARRAFLEEYAREWRAITGETLEYSALDRRTDILERTILLRGLSWCFMAFHEYSAPGRALRNEDTFATIKRYLDAPSCFLG